MKIRDIFKKHESTPEAVQKEVRDSEATFVETTEKSEVINLNVDENDQVVATSDEQVVSPSIIETSVSEPDKIQTIPLSEEEVNNLMNNGYEQAKKICKTTYIIEKKFTGYVDSQDPTNPGRKPVKVKKVAELKAASLMHALKMIGWDKKNVVLVSVKDDNGQIDVRVNGKTIGKVEIPDSKNRFELLSGGQKNFEIRKIESFVASTDLVANYIKDNNMSSVLKTIYVPYRFVNLITKRLSNRKNGTCGSKCECSIVNVSM
jgi:hypothetical protein